MHDKVDTLFASRSIELFAHRLCGWSVSPELFAWLRDLQDEIYQIDDLLEQHWEIDLWVREQIDTSWKQIEQYVEELLGDEEYVEDYLERVRSFFEIEQTMRQVVTPVQMDIDDFYRLKICNIHLARDLILASECVILDPMIRDSIEAFDKLGELVDDLEDIEEDLDSINPNRFLLCGVMQGWEPTRQAYTAYAQEQLALCQPSQEQLLALWLAPEVCGEKIEKLLAKSYHYTKVDLRICTLL